MRIFQFIPLLTACLAGVAGAQDAGAFAERFFRTTITMNARPLLAAAIFEDTDGNLIGKGASVADLIARAYGLQAHQVVDAPAWVYQTHLYDIEAVPPPAALVKSDATRMLQLMLAERFKLETTRATRDMQMLVLATDAARQKQLALEADCAGDARRAEAALRAGRQPAVPEGRPICMSSRALALGLTRHFDETVVDVTGTPSVYMAAYLSLRPMPGYDAAAVARALAESGLVVEKRAVPTDVLVVTAIAEPELDSVDR